MDIRNVLTIGRVFDPIDLGHELCRELGIPEPCIAVCGLNPHAGENGLFGDEEERVIRPAIDVARRGGINVHGPFPGDTVFIDAAAGKWDLVVAMYHDQGLIPVKLLGWDKAVNVTIGLPIVRTSPDHGTAFDIAGQAKASEGSMKAAARTSRSTWRRSTPGDSRMRGDESEGIGASRGRGIEASRHRGIGASRHRGIEGSRVDPVVPGALPYGPQLESARSAVLRHGMTHKRPKGPTR